MADEPKTVQGTDPKPEEKTFTQSQLDAIIKDRLDRDRKNYADYDTVKSELETLRAKEQEREEKELTQTEKLQKQLEDINKTLKNTMAERDQYKEFKTDFEKNEQIKVDIAMEDLTDSQKAVVQKLPLIDQMAAINEFKSIKPSSGEWGKNVGKDKKISSADELMKVRKEYGPSSKEYRIALEKYKKGE